MPRTYSWTTSVWQGDVDPFGELHTTTILRFLQETAHRASADAGYDTSYYDRTERIWLVRRSSVRFLVPIRYGNEVEGRTWVSDFRRVRSQREYEIRVGERLVTRAHTDWVFTDRREGRPRRIPPELEAAFLPEGSPGVERKPFPTPPPPKNVRRFRRRVEAHELDNLEHVNNANYARYVEEAALDILTALGWPLERQRSAGGRLRRDEHDFEYLTAAVYGDQLEALIWPHAIADTSLGFTTWITRPGTPRPLLRARSRYAWTPARNDTTAAMPAALRAAVATALA